MNDMHQTIVPKSDQLNADDLIGREMTITITGVDIKGGQEQPVSIHFEGDNGKPYKACKSMCRVMVSAWGPDSKKYVGRSMTIYRDPKVKWGGMEVGGIRISHMSDIADDMTMALTVTRANKRPFTVRPIQAAAGGPSPKAATAPPPAEPSGLPPDSAGAVAATEFISDEQAQAIRIACESSGVRIERVLLAAKIKTLESMPAANFQRAMSYIEKAAK